MADSNYYSYVRTVTRRIERLVSDLDFVVTHLTEGATLADQIDGTTKHRDLVEAFTELARARVHLVNAHGEISGTVPNFVTQEVPIR